MQAASGQAALEPIDNFTTIAGRNVSAIRSVEEDAGMKSIARPNWLSILVMAAIAVAIGWLVRERLLLTTHERLTHKYRQEIVALAERQAAGLVARLAQDDDQWLDVIVTATSDDRLLVAQTAETELLGLVAHWAALPAESGSRQAAILAHVLAQQAPNLPADRRHPARSLAQRLIVWPVDGRIVNTGKFIADCQAVLLLPEVEPSEIRVAATDPPRPVESPAAELIL